MVLCSVRSSRGRRIYLGTYYQRQTTTTTGTVITILHTSCRTTTLITASVSSSASGPSIPGGSRLLPLLLLLYVIYRVTYPLLFVRVSAHRGQSRRFIMLVVVVVVYTRLGALTYIIYNNIKIRVRCLYTCVCVCVCVLCLRSSIIVLSAHFGSEPVFYAAFQRAGARLD